MTVPSPSKKTPDLIIVAIIPLPYQKKKLKTLDIDYAATIRRVYLEGMDKPIPVDLRLQKVVHATKD